MLESRLFEAGALVSYGTGILFNPIRFFLSETRRVVILTPTLSLVGKSLQPETWHCNKITQL